MRTLERLGARRIALTLAAGLGLAATHALAADTNGATSAAVTTKAEGGSNSAPAALSPGVAELIKMADAGVSGEVIKAYVENSAATSRLTHEDLIALKNHKVPDEVVTLMLKRSGETRVAQTLARNEAAARIVNSRNQAGGGFDPESYDFFRYYYLQPRAEASAHQRLSPYYFPYGVRPYGPTRYYAGPYRGRGYHPQPGFR